MIVKDVAALDIGSIAPEDYRALSRIIYNHVNPYGEFELDMTKRLAIEANFGKFN